MKKHVITKQKIFLETTIGRVAILEGTKLIVENKDPLDGVYKWHTRLPINDDTMSVDELIEDTTDFFSTNPPPGISPINARCISFDVNNCDDDLYPVVYECSVKDFIKNSIEYDIDPYDILGDIKKCAGPEISKLAIDYIKNNDFNIGLVGMDEYGVIDGVNQKTNVLKKF